MEVDRRDQVGIRLVRDVEDVQALEARRDEVAVTGGTERPGVRVPRAAEDVPVDGDVALVAGDCAGRVLRRALLVVDDLLRPRRVRHVDEPEAVVVPLDDHVAPEGEVRVDEVRLGALRRDAALGERERRQVGRDRPALDERDLRGRRAERRGDEPEGQRGERQQQSELHEPPPPLLTGAPSAAGSPLPACERESLAPLVPLSRTREAALRRPPFELRVRRGLLVDREERASAGCWRPWSAGTCSPPGRRGAR